MEFAQALPAGLSPSEEVLGREMGGFDFELTARNARLSAGVAAAGGALPHAHKTGTTIVGLVFKDGIVLGADTRATEDTTVCDKNCEKIHYIAPNIYCCGAGTAADTENTTALIASNLALLRAATGTASRVVTAMTMLKRRLFRYQGHVSAALVLGGVDATGAHLYNVYPHGSTDKLPYVTMGSGSLAAMAVFERGYKDALTEDEGVALVVAAVRAGIFNDLGSGSNVDVTVIRAPAAPGGQPAVKVSRNLQTPNDVEELRRKVTRPAGRAVPRGATTVLKETFSRHVAVVRTTVEPAAGAAGGGAARAAGEMEVV